MGFFSNLFKKKKKDGEAAPAKAEKKAAAAPAAKPAAPIAAGQSTMGGSIYAETDANQPIPGYVPGLGAPEGGKIKLALYWAAACGGCDVSVLDSDEKVLNVGAMADIVM